MPPDPHPPGPQGRLAPVRNLLAIRRDPAAFFLRLAREHGSAASFRLGGRRLYFFSEPEAVREVFVTKASSLRKGFVSPPTWKMFTDLLGNGLLTTHGGPAHTRQRKLVVPAFHKERLAGYARIMADAADAETAAWTDGASVDVAAEMSRLTLIIVARSLFGSDLSGSAGVVKHALDECIHVLERTRSPLYRFTAKKTQALFERGKAGLDDAVASVIADHRQRGGDRGDLLSVLLLARDEETGELGMDDQQVRDEVLTILTAGHETTASALTWTFHLLAQNPDAEQRLHAEVDAVLPGGQPPGLAELGRLVYTRRVLTEAMRLYPPVWAISRWTTEPVEIGGVRLPADVPLTVSPYVTQRDARWFPEPERFLPERWEEGQGPDRPKYAYMPFGGGSRVCAGESFAWMEGTLLLASLARKWKFTADPAKPPPQPLAAVTLRPRDGLWMRLEKRV